MILKQLGGLKRFKDKSNIGGGISGASSCAAVVPRFLHFGATVVRLTLDLSF